MTRSRRGVSRTVASAAPAQPVDVAPAAPAVEPAPEPEAAAVVAPEPPKVVTRTRGGASSSRAAVTSGAVGTPSDSGMVEPNVATVEPGTSAEGAGDDAGDDTETIEHVPVKKKGTRKR